MPINSKIFEAEEMEKNAFVVIKRHTGVARGDTLIILETCAACSGDASGVLTEAETEEWSAVEQCKCLRSSCIDCNYSCRSEKLLIVKSRDCAIAYFM